MDTVEKIKQLKPEYKSSLKVVSVALDRYLEWLVMFDERERKVLQAHADMLKDYERALPPLQRKMVI